MSFDRFIQSINFLRAIYFSTVSYWDGMWQLLYFSHIKKPKISHAVMNRYAHAFTVEENLAEKKHTDDDY